MKTVSPFITYPLLLVFSFCFTSCQKEYSYEGGPLTGGSIAVFTLQPNGGNCTAPVINGAFTKGTALSPSNNIKLQVNVTSTGAYTLATPLVNGIKFSASGNFTATGLQTVTLTGSGTPLAEGIFPFTPSIGLGCTFSATVIKAPPLFASFTLEGAPGTCSDFSVSGMYVAGNAFNGDNTVEVTVNVTAIGFYSLNTDTINGITFLRSGYFTATGIQRIILNGVGTPATANFFTFTPHVASSACTFSLTVVPPAPPASYVLESIYDHSCTAYAVTGAYYSDTPLISTNRINVKVFVTEPGNFAISTNIVNGMMFYYMGSFVSTGSQFVILTGSGTPVSAGTFTFTPQIIGSHPLGGETCTTDIVVH